MSVRKAKVTLWYLVTSSVPLNFEILKKKLKKQTINTTTIAFDTTIYFSIKRCLPVC